MFDSPLSDYVSPYSYDPAVAELQKAAMAIGLARREVDFSRLIGTYTGLGDSDILTKGFSHTGWITIHHEAPDEEGEMVTHVFVGKGGIVTKGPRHLIGANIAHLPSVPIFNKNGGHHKFHAEAHLNGAVPQGHDQHPQYAEYTPKAPRGGQTSAATGTPSVGAAAPAAGAPQAAASGRGGHRGGNAYQARKREEEQGQSGPSTPAGGAPSGKKR